MINDNKTVDNDNLELRNFGEINLLNLSKRLFRWRKFIALCTGSSIFISFLYALSTKPLWEGEFVIVIDDKNDQMGNITSFAGLPQVPKLISGKFNRVLNTEVEVLKSPSILLPVFNYVKSNKASKNSKFNQWNYLDWSKDYLDIDLKIGTSVLKIKYRDEDKDLVIPVLSKISSEYRKYSQRDTKRRIKNGIIYLENQIKKFNDKSVDSYSKHKEFAMQYNLEVMDDMRAKIEIPNIVSNIPPKKISSDSSISSSSISNSIKTNDMFLKLVKESKDDDLTEISSLIINQSENNEFIANLRKDKEALIRLSKIYKPNDITIKQKQESISNSNEILRNLLLSKINADKKDLLIKSKSIELPKEILIKHKLLTRNAIRDEKTLVTLENQLNQLYLENAKQTETWELITKPTLLDKPVKSLFSRYIFLGSLLGLISGISIAFVKDKLSKKIYDIDEFSLFFDKPILANFSLEKKSSWSDMVKILKIGVLSDKSKNKSAIIPVGDFPKLMLDKFNNLIQSDFIKDEVIISSNFLEVQDCQDYILLVAPTITKKDELNDLKSKFKIIGSNVKGYIVLDQNFL